MKNDLHDGTVVIVGASSGIGRAAALAFARCGANLVLAARRQDPLERTARDCEALGVGAIAVPADVADAAQMREVAQAAADTPARSRWCPSRNAPSSRAF